MVTQDLILTPSANRDPLAGHFFDQARARAAAAQARALACLLTPGQQAGNRHLATMKGRRRLVVADRSTNLAPAEPPVTLVLGGSKSAVLA
jgi:hypothetical protein